MAKVKKKLTHLVCSKNVMKDGKNDHSLTTYTTTKPQKGEKVSVKLTFKKHCKVCNAHTDHVEKKVSKG